MASRLPRIIAAAIGAFIFVLGVWAFADPQAFYNQLAAFPPYNKHLFHDVGSFQMGIGSGLFLGAFMSDALLLGLTAGAIGSVVHEVSHIIDRNLGGRTTDPWGLGLLALLLVAGALLRARELRRG